MNDRQLRYFCAVVDAGSTALAASQLFVAPTAISTQVNLLEKELYNLRYQMKISQVEKPHRIKRVRREIAKCKTIIKEKELLNAQK